MKPKLVASIAFAMVALMLVSTLAVLPVARAVNNIYMTPSTVPTAPSIGKKFNITIWVDDYAGVFAYQVMFKIINPAAGVIVTRAWEPAASDPDFIFYLHATIRPTPVVTPTSALVGDTVLDTAANPPPAPAKLAIIELQITAAPAKFEILTTGLNINNVDTYLLDSTTAEIPTTKTDGVYNWTWVPPTSNPNMAVRLVDPGLAGAVLVNPQLLQFDAFHVWNGTHFVAQVWIENLDIGWALTSAMFDLSYNATLTSLVSANLDPNWVGIVDTSVPGTIHVAVTPVLTPSGSVLVLGIEFDIIAQGSAPPAALGHVDESALVFSGVFLEDHVGPINTNPAKNGLVQVTVKQTLPNPYLQVDPATIVSGTDLVIGDQFGKIFTVNVDIHNLTSAWSMVAVQFRLTYDPNYIIPLSVTEGPYMQNPIWNLHGTFFVAQDFRIDPVFGPNVAVGAMILPDPDTGIWSMFPGSGVPPQGPMSYGTIATFVFAYVGQDFTTTHYIPLALKDFGSVPPAHFVDKDDKVIPAGPRLNGTVEIDPISMIGRRIDVWMQYPAPYGGQGINQPADLVVPQQEIILTAKVTYNWWPVAQKKVTFNIYDNQHNVVAVLTGVTGDDGHAVVSFRMPWPNVNPEGLFGVWTVVASVSVADVTVTDTLQFHYDYLVRITGVTTNKVSYNHLEYVKVTVAYASQAQQVYAVTLAETLSDELGVPVSVAWVSSTVSGAVFCSYKTYAPAIMSLYIPYYAYAGLATVHVNFLNEPPTTGTHVAVTPEATANVYILPV